MIKVHALLLSAMACLSGVGTGYLVVVAFIGADTYTCKIDRIDGEFTTEMKIVGANRMKFEKDGKIYLFEIQDMECSPND